MNRRNFLRISGTVGALGLLPVARSQLAPSQRFLDTTIRSLDPSFDRYRGTVAKVERIAIGMRWCEGPVWNDEKRHLLWSDLFSDCMMCWDEGSGQVSVFRKPAQGANGNTWDRQGRLLTCEARARRVVRTERDGSTTVVADSFEGRRLNAPNDIVCKTDESIWFTDPTEGQSAEGRLPSRVYRWDPNSKSLTVVVEDLKRPNGIAFSPDESALYVIDSRASPRSIYRYDVGDRGGVSNSRVLIAAQPEGTPDGMRIDVDGNLWCGWGAGAGLDGVRIFNSKGKPIGHIDLPERCANLCFGGQARNQLFMCATTSVYSLVVGTHGVRG